MLAWSKLLQNIQDLDKDLQFEELRKVMEHYGYEMKRPKGGSSHATFRKANRNPITIPTGYPIGKVYIKMVRDMVLKEEGEL